MALDWDKIDKMLDEAAETFVEQERNVEQNREIFNKVIESYGYHQESECEYSRYDDRTDCDLIIKINENYEIDSYLVSPCPIHSDTDLYHIDEAWAKLKDDIKNIEIEITGELKRCQD